MVHLPISNISSITRFIYLILIIMLFPIIKLHLPTWCIKCFIFRFPWISISEYTYKVFLCSIQFVCGSFKMSIKFCMNFLVLCSAPKWRQPITSIIKPGISYFAAHFPHYMVSFNSFWRHPKFGRCYIFLHLVTTTGQEPTCWWEMKCSHYS